MERSPDNGYPILNLVHLTVERQVLQYHHEKCASIIKKQVRPYPPLANNVQVNYRITKLSCKSRNEQIRKEPNHLH